MSYIVLETWWYLSWSLHLQKGNHIYTIAPEKVLKTDTISYPEFSSRFSQIIPNMGHGSHHVLNLQILCRYTWSDIVRYLINNCRNWGRISIRCWIPKRHIIPQPNKRAMGSVFFLNICEKINHVITAPHCTWARVKHVLLLNHYEYSWWHFLSFIFT